MVRVCLRAALHDRLPAQGRTEDGSDQLEAVEGDQADQIDSSEHKAVNQSEIKISIFSQTLTNTENWLGLQYISIQKMLIFNINLRYQFSI